MNLYDLKEMIDDILKIGTSSWIGDAAVVFSAGDGTHYSITKANTDIDNINGNIVVTLSGEPID